MKGIHKDANVPGSAGCVVLPTGKGWASFSLLSKLVKVDGKIIVIPAKSNLAEMFVPTGKPEEEKSLNAELLIAGLARYRESDNCPNQEAFNSAQQEAEAIKAGIWKPK